MSDFPPLDPRSPAGPPTAPASPEPPTPPAAPSVKIEHTGEWRELLPIVIKNFLFNIITLGFYRFWGRTKVRRYLWSNTIVNGTPAEYTGTGLELFLGFLVAAGIFFIFALIGEFAFGTSADPTTLVIYQLGFFVFIIFLTGFAIYRARRYRLSRTNWRGIRGSTTGSAWRHALRWFGYNLLMIPSLGFAFPWIRRQLQAPLVRESQIGGTNFGFEAKAGPLYGPFFVCLAMTMVVSMAAMMLVVVVSLIAALVGGGLEETFRELSTAFENQDGENGEMSDLDPTLVGIATAIGAVFGVAVYLLTIAVFAVYFYFETRHFLRHMSFGDLKFDVAARDGELIKLAISNFFLNALTLGIAYPLVQLRSIKFFVNRLSFAGAVDLEQLVQTAQEKPTTGEGFAEMFDVGNI